MTLLLLSIAALLAGPLIVGLVGLRPGLRRGLDGYVLVTVAGLVVLHLLPPALSDAGPLGWIALAAGLLTPWLIERRMNTPDGPHTGATLFAVGGLALHALLDGAALAGPHETHGHAHGSLALAVIVHRLPMGLLIWWAVSEVAGRRAVIGMLALMTAATVAGFALGEAVLSGLSSRATAVFIALVAGALLHVVGHALRGHAGHRAPLWTALVGGALGAGTVAALTLLGG